MTDLLILTHSTLRYFILVFLLILLFRSFQGWQKKSAFTATDNKVSLWLFILTHSQLLVGLILYFISPLVIFDGASMKNAVARYWLVEHITIMLIAVILITVARVTAKKMTDAVAKHKRLFIFNLIALICIVAAIAMSGRGFFNFPEI
ncbi:MAG: cytochrome B [Cyclobacteriaceae bacterium]|nr:MAG: cytochrome B [Cyclobacteriaceae bacterium]